MKIITVIAEQVSPEALNAALPKDGVHTVTISEAQSFTRTAAVVESYRGRKIAKHVTCVYRVEIVADDDAVQRIVDGVAFARGAGLLGNARAWISAEATDLFATAGVRAASA
jgi:nitrogen regulatory protein P-II 1